MSTLKADTIVASDGTSPVTLTKQSAAKAFACVDNETATTTATASFNIASTTDNGTGDFSLSWTNSMNSTPYTFGHICQNNQGDAYARGIGVRSTASSQQTPNGMSTSSCRFVCFYASNSVAAGNGIWGYNALALHGDLA
jgi:hypothetical protein